MDVATARRLLEEERERLVRARAAIVHDHLDDEPEEESLGELAGIDQHQADIGSEVFEREKEFSLRARIETDLRDVDDAVARLHAGVYGWCQTCREPIGDDRLEAVPAARFCDVHQRIWELSHIAVSGPGGEVAVAPRRSGFGGSDSSRDLSFLPDDDEPSDVIELAIEEAALHDSKARLIGASLELIEAREAARVEREHDEEDSEDAEHLAAVLAVEREEDLLDLRSRER